MDFSFYAWQEKQTNKQKGNYSNVLLPVKPLKNNIKKYNTKMDKVAACTFFKLLFSV